VLGQRPGDDFLQNGNTETKDQTKEFAKSPDWLFQGINAGTMQYDFAHVDRSTYRESSFLDHRMTPAPSVVEGADIDSINRILNNHGRPANYIFHSAFCCSTLFSNCLQSVSDSLVLKEPEVLGHLANSLARTRTSAGFNLNRWLGFLTPSLLLLEKHYPDQHGVIIKPTNAANILIEDIFRVRRSKTIFMFSSLSDFLLSNLKGPDESRQMIPEFLKRVIPLTDYARKIPGMVQLDHLQQCAVLWHAQLYQFLLLGGGNDSVRYLAADDFLAEPGAIVSRALEFLDLPCDEERLDQLATSGPLSRHSKSGDQFDAAKRADENAAVMAQHAGELQEVFEWMDESLKTLPIDPPLKAQL